VPGQLLCGPLAPFVCSSGILQPSAGAAELPLTVACNVTWPLAAIVTADGETVTVTLLGSKLLPPLQPAIATSRTSDTTQKARYECIADLLQKHRFTQRDIGDLRRQSTTKPLASTAAVGAKSYAWERPLGDQLSRTDHSAH